MELFCSPGVLLYMDPYSYTEYQPSLSHCFAEYLKGYSVLSGYHQILTYLRWRGNLFCFWYYQGSVEYMWNALVSQSQGLNHETDGIRVSKGSNI